MKKKLLIGLGVITLLILMSLAWLIFAPAGPIVVGRDTTYLTEPIGANGMVDYEQAIVDLQGAGVTPEENAAIPLLTAIWPAGLEPEQQTLVCEAIGMPMPEQDGLVMLDDPAIKQSVAAELNALGKSHPGYSDVEADDNQVVSILYKSAAIPWSREQLPALAQWVEEQQPHVAALSEIDKRPQFFLPSPDLLDADREGLLAADNAAFRKLRDLADVLKLRAMLAIGEDRPVDAWVEIQTLFALSRCHNRPGALIDTLFGNSMRIQACDALAILLASGECDAQLLGEIDSVLAQLKPLDELPATVGVMERLTTLEAAIHLLHSGDDEAPAMTGMEKLKGFPIDQNAMLLRLNAWYDQLTTALETEEPVECQLAVRQFDRQLREELDASMTAGNLASALFSHQVRGEFVASLLADLMLPAVQQAVWSEQRVNAQVQALRVTVALERYHGEHGAYPTELATLADKLDPALLIDPHAKKPLRYELRPPGFLLYAIGPDGKDDGGNSPDGNIVQGEWALENPNESSFAGDQVIRFPHPAQSITDFLPWNLPPDEEFDWEEQDSISAGE